MIQFLISDYSVVLLRSFCLSCHCFRNSKNYLNSVESETFSAFMLINTLDTDKMI